jgi:hypothetical protein
MAANKPDDFRQRNAAMIQRSWAAGTIFLLSALTIAPVFAAEPNPFAGAWVLDASRSRAPAAMLPKSETRVYGSNVEGALTVVIEGVGADGEAFAYAATGDLNGRSYPVVGRDVGARTLGDTISWFRPDPLTVEMKVVKKGEVINLTRHSLSDGGKTLTVGESLIDDKGERSESVKVFGRP